MPDRPDINDMREKLRRQKKDKNQTDESHLLGPDDTVKKEQPEEQQENNESEHSETDENFKEETDSLDDSVIIENHYDYEDSHGDDSEQKTERPQKKKKNFKLPKLKITPARIILLAAVFAVLLLGVLVWYVMSSASDVKEITYSGNQVITDEELSNRLQFEEGDKMFSINTTQARENIELLPVIVDVTVDREWWNTVHVEVNEYNIIAYIENEGSFNPVMENARVLRGYPVSPSIGPILYHFEGEEFESVVSELKNIDEDILANISEIQFSPSETSQTRIHLFMNDGQEVVADYRDFGEKLNHYVGMKQEIGSEDEGIIDIEIGSSFLPYGSREAEEVKSGIDEEPVQVEYIDNINSSLSSVKDSLNQIDQEENEEETTETEETEDEENSNSSE